MANIDIVIPSYQYGRYLGECITSILTQGVEDLRILVIDNASTDDSVEVARQFAAKDPRIEVRAREKNLGFHASLNEGIDWASGEYFLIVCADDLMAPGSLRRALTVLDENRDVSFVYGKVYTWEGLQPLPDLTTRMDHVPCTLIDCEQFIEVAFHAAQGHWDRLVCRAYKRPEASWPFSARTPLYGRYRDCHAPGLHWPRCRS